MQGNVFSDVSFFSANRAALVFFSFSSFFICLFKDIRNNNLMIFLTLLCFCNVETSLPPMYFVSGVFFSFVRYFIYWAFYILELEYYVESYTTYYIELKIKLTVEVGSSFLGNNSKWEQVRWNPNKIISSWRLNFEFPIEWKLGNYFRRYLKFYTYTNMPFESS